MALYPVITLNSGSTGLREAGRAQEQRREQEARELEKAQKEQQERAERERQERQERLEREKKQQHQQQQQQQHQQQQQQQQQQQRERMEQQRQEEQKRAAEQAVHKHFEESLRLAHQKRNSSNCWSLIHPRPPACGPSHEEEQRKRADQEAAAVHQQRLLSERIRQESRERQPSYYPPTVPRSSSGAKCEYPPPAHSRINSIKTEKQSGHTALPKAEPNLNLFNYPSYQPTGFLPHDTTKVKSEQKSSLGVSSLSSGKSSGAPMMLDRERELMLSNPPPLMNDVKNSVIVKNEGKSPHLSEPSKVPPSHSPSPKLRVTDMISSQPSHYLSPSLPQHKPAGVYEYRSPTHSPHHLAPRHTPSPHHSIAMEPQNLANVGKVHSRPPSQQSSPLNHPHRQSPHQHALIQQSQHPSPPDQRYPSQSNPASHAYGLSKANVGSYPYPSAGLVTTASHYSLAQGSSANAGSKPKVVSSPAPPHIYGKPGLSPVISPGITSGTPVCRPSDTNVNSPLPLTSKAPLSSSVSPSPYQQMSHHHPPPQPAPPGPAPPPAHSSRSSMDHRMMYDTRQYPLVSHGMPGGPISKPPPHNQGSSPPSAAAAPMPPASRSSPLQIHHSHPVHPASLASMYQTQTQPLDLGVSSERNREEMTGSPKRKGMPMHHSPIGTLMDANKKRRCELTLGAQTPPQTLQPVQSIQTLSQPMLARVSEPSPLIASAATTITTVVNTAAYCSQAMTMVVTVPTETTLATTLSSSPHPVPLRTSSGDGSRPASTGSVSALTPAHTPTPPTPSLFPPTNSSVPSQRSSPVTLAPPANCSSPNLPQQQGQVQQLQQQPPSGHQQQQTLPSQQQSQQQSQPQLPSSQPLPSPQQPSSNTPMTPAKPAPSSADSEKSNSPGPARPTTGSSYPVHKLKKAWLQRHSGEDGVSNSGGVGTGSCVALPILTSTSNSSSNSTNGTSLSNKEVGSNSTVSSFANVGSTAVASIPKGKPGAGNKNRKPINKEVTVNGHASDVKPSIADDSSSTDNELEQKSPPKRKPQIKKKRKAVKKAGSDEKKKKVPPAAPPSDSGSESEKETGSEKDSDSGASTNQSGGGKKTANGGNGASGTTGGNSGGNAANNNKEPRKRGRRPKSSKNERGEEPRQKKSRDDPPAPQRNPFRKPPVSQLKKTGESFLQDGPCHEVAPKLAKCRECRWTPNQRSRNMPNIFCRFYAFRRLRYTKNGQLAIAGFSDPHRDASEEDMKLWLPQPDSPPTDLDVQTSRFLLSQVGDQFCDLLKQEEESVSIHMSEDKTVAWKRVVKGVREMCDVCETTLFNFHWACGKCGFAVCIDCYKGRKNGTVKIWGEAGKDRDDFSWLLCTNRQPHEQEKLMLTQIIASDSLLKLGRKCHEIRAVYNIPQYCGCPLSKEVVQKPLNGISKDLLRNLMKNEPINGLKVEKKEKDASSIDVDKKTGSANGAVKQDDKNSLSLLADVVLQNEDKKDIGEDLGSTSDSDDDKEGNYSTLRELLIRPSHKSNGNGSRSASPSSANAPGSSGANSNSQNNTSTKGSKKLSMDTLDAVISSVIESSVQSENTDETGTDTKPVVLKHFIRRYYRPQTGREPLPIRIMTLTESQALFPDVPHSWLCDGKLLRLSDPNHNRNYSIFQDQWKRGQPVIVSDVAKHLDMSLWHPDSFSRDFGDDKNDLINCMTGNLVPNQPMRKFWEGFENFAKRLKDDRGNPMLLKLKDWPPGDDFAEMLPSRFSDLMTVLPLSDYTHRTGRLNLASRLPECFVRPDLGPKMYNAYGSAIHPSKGTTNLHLDISDAVNVMVYVGIPKDSDMEDLQKEVSRAIEDAPCDFLTKRRVREKDEVPGALWHIYNANDADKIRDLLNKVAVERGVRLEPHHDPIHDQSWYLDAALRERLYKEYCVEGYAIVQCLGDAVFIPAGAPHQVRNLHNCIKVAEDFVSPENVSHCFHLTQEFRELSDTHSNHEDKLQIKNIIYHAVKDSLSVLTKLAGICEDASSSVCSAGESLINGTNSEDKPSANGNNEDSNNCTNNSASSSEAEATLT